MLIFEVHQQAKTPVADKWLKEVAQAFYKQSGLKGDWHFSLAFIGNPAMRRLNRLYRKVDANTDVLSFGENSARDKFWSVDNQKYLGEIIIAVPQARKQARVLKCSLKAEVARLLVHGLAHLAGYNHESGDLKKAKRMLKLEKRILVALKLWKLFRFEEELGHPK